MTFKGCPASEVSLTTNAYPVPSHGQGVVYRQITRCERAKQVEVRRRPPLFVLMQNREVQGCSRDSMLETLIACQLRLTEVRKHVREGLALLRIVG